MNSLQNWRRDLHQAARRLMRSPAFTGVAIAILALAIGTNVAVFTLVRRVILADLPYPAADRLVGLDHSAVGLNLPSGLGMSIGVFREYANLPSTDAIAIYDVGEATLTGRDVAERVDYLYTTPQLGGILGIRPALGRWFAPEEGVTGAPRVAILTDALWRRRFGADAGIVGTSIRLDGRSYEVVGVLPPSFAFASARVQLVTALPLPVVWSRASGFNYQGIARLASGSTLDDALRDQNRAISQLETRYPSDSDLRALGRAGKLVSLAQPLKLKMLGNAAATLWILFGAGLVVLAMACANLGNLMLIRADVRHKEIVLRQALGANRGNVIMFFLSEALVIAGIGGALGVVVAYVAIGLLVTGAPVPLPRLDEVRIDGVVLGFALLATIVAALGLGAIPLFRHFASGTSALADADRTGTAGASRMRARYILMGTQIAFAAILLGAAGLLVRSFDQLLAVDPGFRSESRLVFRVGLPRSAYPSSDAAAVFHIRATERLRGIAGVQDVGVTTTLPLDGIGIGNPIEVEGRMMSTADVMPTVRLRRVSDGYFGSMGIPIVSANESGGVIHPVYINEALARQYFASTDPVGKRVRSLRERGQEWMTIVGVVANTATSSLHEEASIPQLFATLRDSVESNLPGAHEVTYVVRVAGNDPMAAVTAVRKAFAEIDRDVAVARPEPLTDVVERARATLSFTTVLLVLAAAVALALGVVGVFAVVSYGVTQRSAEIGVRLALGATPGDVVAMILRQNGKVVVAGLAVGIVASLASARLLQSVLFRVPPTDARTFSAVAAGLFGLAMLACWLPARRASRLDPLRTLRR